MSPMNNRVFYLTGCDGSGKTTYIELVEQKLIDKGHLVKSIWLRSPKILSKPLMAYCRLAGLTQYKTINGQKYGKHQFNKSKIVSMLYPLFQLVDFKIKWFFVKQKIKPNQIIVFDRFAVDTLADIMVSTGNMNLHKSFIGRAFIKMVPKNTKMAVLNVDESVIRMRKKDTLHDEKLSDKISAFKILSNHFNIPIIDNNRNKEMVETELVNFFNV